MKAIVLTCDKYIKLAHHMIATYEKIWPSHPFIFRLPYENYPNHLKEKYADKVELVKIADTNLSIKSTLLSLLEDLSDEEWIYWCMDDRYLISLNERKANQTLDWMRSIRDPEISGICFARVRNLYKTSNVEKNDFLMSPNKQIFLKRKNYNQIWLHQFLRVKVLRRLFSLFPDRNFSPKEMDGFKDKVNLIQEHRLYVIKTNIVIFGESTTRGKITRNCATSLARYNIDFPDNFKVSNKEIVIGKMYNFSVLNQVSEAFSSLVRKLKARLSNAK